MDHRILFILLLGAFILPVTAQQTEPVKIGLLIQDKSSLAAKEGAELAVKAANEKGGFHGRPFQIITKSMEGPWGTGSKQAVSLIFEDEVWALLGSHDGRNAHLVEQASTKSIVSFVSIWSSDPTLSQAFVPWFFNCVPNDEQQAEGLLGEIYDKRNFARIVTITDDAYDSNQSLKGFIKTLNRQGKNKPYSIDYDKNTPVSLQDQIAKSKADCFVLFCKPANALQIIRILRELNISEPVFGTLSILNENELSREELNEFRNAFFPLNAWSGSKVQVFLQAYRDNYKKNPGMVAAYSFDGMNVLIEAIKTAGSPDREKIQQALRLIQYEGVTGNIRFDNMGSRRGIPVISHPMPN